MSSANLIHRQQPHGRAKSFAEVYGVVRGLRSLRESDRCLLLFRQMGSPRCFSVWTDRTGFFWRRHIPVARYGLCCQIVCSGLVTSVGLGVVELSPGICEMLVTLLGSSLRGTVSEARYNYGTPAEVALICHDGIVRHTAILDEHGRFAFHGVDTGTYDLEGEAVGLGLMTVKGIDVLAPTSVDVGDIRLTQRPYLFFCAASCGGVRLRCAVSGGAVWFDASGRVLAERNLQPVRSGVAAVEDLPEHVCEYTVQPRGYRAIHGRLQGIRRENCVTIQCERQRARAEWSTVPRQGVPRAEGDL